MNQLLHLQKQAIEAAKQGDWKQAVELNQQILEGQPEDVSALNRLAFCYTQLEQRKKAIETYQAVLDIERMNPVAKKYLDLLKKKIAIKRQPSASYQDFVEEPGKTKVVMLDRLCDQKTLQSLSVASHCILKCKGRYVVVTTSDGEYIGSLPEDISFHLSQLLKTGNRYDCVIKSVNGNSCMVFIKEEYRSPENAHTPSFYISSKLLSLDGEDEILPIDMMEDGSSPVVEEAEPGESLSVMEDDDMAGDDKEQLPPDILGDVMK